MPKKIIDQAYAKAVEVIEACERPTGFYASGLPGGYEATWARDSMITSLGASLVGDKFKKTFKASLELLAKNQTENGLIPNCVGSYNIERRSDVTFNSIDAPQWFIIGHYVYASAYRDTSLIEKHRKAIAKAYVWLRYQDPNEDKLIVQQPTMDWMDAFPHKYGRVLHTQTLQHAVHKLIGNDKAAEHMKNVMNGKIEKYLSLYDPKLGFYYPRCWKDHDGDKEHEEWFDSCANVLAILTGLATPAIAKGILKHIEKEKINEPFALKAIWPPIKPGDPEWKSYFEKCDARDPLSYLNGGIWPFIGGLYIAALVKMKEYEKAGKELEKLAKGDLQIIDLPHPPQYLEDGAKKHKMKVEDLALLRKKEFNEWLHGADGTPRGEPYQAWTAGTYIYGYECLKRKKALFF